MKRFAFSTLLILWTFAVSSQTEQSPALKRKLDILRARMEINSSPELAAEYERLKNLQDLPGQEQKPTAPVIVAEKKVETKTEKKAEKKSEKRSRKVAEIIAADPVEGTSVDLLMNGKKPGKVTVIAPVVSAEEKGELSLKVQDLEQRLRDLEGRSKTVEAPAVAAVVEAPPKPLFTYRGHFQYRLEGAKNTRGVKDAFQRDQSFYRFRTYTTLKPREKIEFNLTPQATKGFGENQNAQTTSGSSNHTSIFFFEANLKYQFTDTFSAKLGKQEVAYGDHLVIGTAPWDNNGRSFDALRFRMEHSNGWSELLYSKVDNSNTNLDSTDDANLAVLYNSWSFSEPLKTADLYLINQQDERQGAPEVNMFGMRMKGSAGPAFYRTENAVQKGRRLGDAFQMLAEVGATYKALKLSGEFAVAGDDYRQLYPTAHRFLGFADVVGRRNIEHYALHFAAEISPDLSLLVDQHLFRRHNPAKSAYRLNGATAWGTAGDDRDIGTETDVVLNYKAPQGLNFQLGAAFFNPGKYLEAQAQGTDKQTRFTYIQVYSEF